MASIDLEDFSGFDPTYEEETNHYYWALPQSDFPTPQKNTAGVSFDLDADSDASDDYYINVKSSFGYTYNIPLGGGPVYVETNDCNESPLINIV